MLYNENFMPTLSTPVAIAAFTSGREQNIFISCFGLSECH